MLVVVAAGDGGDMGKVGTAEGEESIEGGGTERADTALGGGVRVWRLDRRTDHLDPLAPEHIVEGVAELRVPVVDEKPERLLVAELDREVARLLGDPTSVRIRGARDVLDPSCR